MREYSILLVDDEAIALRGIEHGIRWEEIGIHTIYKAESLREAVRMFEEHDISIMLSDIEMPGGSGLDLIRWVREHRPEVVCIFYTCHAEFSYAQEAIRLGVMDYLLKPIPYKDLETILVKGLDRLKSQNDNKKLADLWHDVTETPNEDDAISEVKKFILDNIDVDIKREELAAAVHLNPDYLSRLFKKKEGISITEYILQKKISLAKKMLRDTRLSVVEIGQRVGFGYSSYFVKIFKKKTGVTPQQYRKEEED